MYFNIIQKHNSTHSTNSFFFILKHNNFHLMFNTHVPSLSFERLVFIGTHFISLTMYIQVNYNIVFNLK